MKVMHIIGGGDVGGAKTHVLSLVRALSDTIDVQLVSLRKGVFADDAKKMGIRVSIVRHRNIFRDLSVIANMIKKQKIDMIHAHGTKANLFAAIMKKKTGVITISTVHSDYRLDYMHNPFKQFTYGFVNALALHKLDFHIGVSNVFKRMLIERNFIPEKIFTVYNGIDFTDHPRAYDRNTFIQHHALRIDPHDILVGIATRLDKVKGIDTLIEAAALVKTKNKNVKFIVAGEGEHMRYLKMQIKKLGVDDIVFLVGWLTDPFELIGIIDIGVLTSISESFPYSILEGVKYKLPTVSTHVGGIPDLITHNETGLLFDPKDATALSNHLLSLAENETIRKRLGENIYNKASMLFSLQNMCQTQLAIYRSILSFYESTDFDIAHCDCVLLGYYGFNNIGDDALLSAICNTLKHYRPEIKIVALSKNPEQTKAANKIQSIYRNNPFRVIHTFRNSKLFAYGGGTLIQESTSTRSLLYYLALMYLAKKMNLKTMLYANGIEPIRKRINKKLTSGIINNVDIITLREQKSVHELHKLGVHTPKIVVTADPAFTCEGIDSSERLQLLQQEGIPAQVPLVGFSMRFWKDNGRRTVTILAEVADYLYETHGLTTVFIPMQHRYVDDVKFSRMIMDKMTHPCHLLKQKYSISETIGIISHLKLLIGMRLHSLIFAACKSIPMVGISYEPKVARFMEYIDMSHFCAGTVIDLDIDTMKSLCKKALQQEAQTKKHLANVHRTLYDKCMENAKLAVDLMEEN